MVGAAQGVSSEWLGGMCRWCVCGVCVVVWVWGGVWGFVVEFVRGWVGCVCVCVCVSSVCVCLL